MCGVEIVYRYVVGEQSPAANLLIAGVNSGDIGAVDAVLVFAVEVNPFAVVHGVTQDLAWIDFHAVKTRRGVFGKAADSNRFAAYLALKGVTYCLRIHCFTHPVEFLSL